jgi:hypothetical protein
MNIEIFNKINVFIELLMSFRHFDFVTEKRFVIVENPEYNHLWIQTHKTNKDLIGGFVPINRDLYFGPTFRLSKSGRKPLHFNRNNRNKSCDCSSDQGETPTLKL